MDGPLKLIVKDSSAPSGILRTQTAHPAGKAGGQAANTAIFV